jgi:hypothetical protein
MTARLLSAATVALLAAAAAACEKDESIARAEPQKQTCRMPFTEYDAGPAVRGIPFEARAANCGRRPFVGYIYGTCEASSDSGCAPPLEVQTWSYCHRKPRASTASELEVARGEVTVVVFARNRALARRAVRGLREAKPADPSLPLTRKLRGCGER